MPELPNLRDLPDLKVRPTTARCFGLQSASSDPLQAASSDQRQPASSDPLQAGSSDPARYRRFLL